MARDANNDLPFVSLRQAIDHLLGDREALTRPFSSCRRRYNRKSLDRVLEEIVRLRARVWGFRGPNSLALGSRPSSSRRSTNSDFSKPPCTCAVKS